MLLFYRKHDPVVDNDTGEVTSSGIYGIIHSCEMRSDISSQRKARMHETELCSQWKMESSPIQDGRRYERGQCPNVPLLRSVAVESLQEHVYVVAETPGIHEQWNGQHYVWTMEDQRSEWSKVFLSAANIFN
jgi:hypothetical protein